MNHTSSADEVTNGDGDLGPQHTVVEPIDGTLAQSDESRPALEKLDGDVSEGTAREKPLDSRSSSSRPTGATPHSRTPRDWTFWYRAAMIVAYLVLVVTGVTTSSIASELIRENTAVADGTLVNDAQVIRTDEYLTYTPILLGYINSGGERSVSPLGQEPDLIYQLPSGDLAESLVFFDGSLMRLGHIIPPEMLFAAYWWFPTLLLALTLPGLLERFGATRPLSYMATALFFFAPSVMWWSHMPVRLTAFAAAGSLLIIRATDAFLAQRRVAGVLQCLLAGLLMARMPTNYVPWSIALGVPLVLATIAWLVTDRERRKPGLIATGIAGGTAALLFGLVVLENLASLKSEFATLYPGLRLTPGETMPIDALFGAPLLYNLDDYYPTATNQSELASAYTICAVWVLILWLGHRRWSWQRSAGPVAVLAIFTGLFFSWCTVEWGGLGRALPILNRIPPFRAAQIVGLLAAMLLAIVLSRAGRRTSTRVWLTAGIAATLLTGAAGSQLMETRNAPMFPREVGLVAMLVGLLVAWLTARPRSRLAALAVSIAAFLVVAPVNPLQRGLSDLKDSALARYIEKQPNDELWAADSTRTDAVLVASGVPSLTGHQVTGPRRDEWKKLDPAGTAEEAWNRGASFIVAEWTDDQEPVVTVMPNAPDTIVIKVDPCALHDFGFDVQHLISSHELTYSCLSSQEKFPFAGQSAYVYRVND